MREGRRERGGEGVRGVREELPVCSVHVCYIYSAFKVRISSTRGSITLKY